MNNKRKNTITTILFTIFFCTMFFLNIIKSDEKISISERRNLAQFPSFSYKSLFDGTFFNKFDSYATDQFVERESFRKAKVNLDLMFKHNYHDIYVYNKYLVEQLYPFSEKSLLNLTTKISKIKDLYLKDNNIYFSIIPDKNYFINNGNLKIDYSLLEKKMCDNLSFANYINIFDKLNLSDYYKTDSHWKSENLEIIASTLLNSMNNNEVIPNSYASSVSDFKGVYASRLPIKTDYDEIKIINNNYIENAIVFNPIKNEYSKIYNHNKLKSLDKYDIYLSGAEPLLTITNSLSNNEKRLIIFRDSFGSSLTPWLISSYKEITLVDTRYISPVLLKDYIDFENADILFLYSSTIINNSYTLK